MQESKVHRDKWAIVDQKVMLDLWDQRATRGLLDQWGQKGIGGPKVKKDLLGLMVHRVSQGYKALQDPQGTQAAMGQMETMDLLVSLRLMALMDLQAHPVSVDLRVNLRYQ